MIEWNGKWHPFAERFPMLSEQELRDMAESIKETGQLVPCVMNSEGLGIDGRNRVAACRIAGVEPKWTVNDGNPMSVIVGANVHHRSLTTGQRAMAKAWELEANGMREGGAWKAGAVANSIPDDLTGSGKIKNWRQRLAEAGLILDWLRNLADDVLGGELSLDAAYRQANEERERQEVRAAEDEQRRKRVGDLPNDLAALVDGGVRDLDDAEREAEYRTTVADTDQIRDADGAPTPSFGDRVETGALTWGEAARLAEDWKRDRDESIGRDAERLRKVTDGWAAVRFIADNTDLPYATAVLDLLEPSRREAVRKIVKQLGTECE